MINQKSNTTLPYLAIIAGGLLLFLPFLGTVALFDWDEVNFAEIAREMIVSKDYLNVQINFQPFWEKPPLFIWMQVLSMKLFGINEFAARFPNSICGIATLLVIYGIGKKLYDQKMGLIWVLVYAGSILPFFYFKSGIIDPWFNLFIFVGVYFAVIYIQATSRKPQAASFLSGAAIGLAILTKGPVGFLIFGLTAFVYLLIMRFRVKIKLVHILLFFAGLILTGGSWFLVMIANGHLDVVKDFIIYQVRLFNTKDAGHGGFPGYHVVILLLGVFPASAFLFGGFKASPDENPLQKEWRRIMIILLLTVVILFEIVQTKIVHYSSLAYFPLTFLSSLYIYNTYRIKGKLNRASLIMSLVLGILWIVVIIGLTLVGLNKEWLMNSGLIKDQFAVANLAAEVKWTGWEVLVATALGIGLLGFFFMKNPVNKVISLFTGSLIFTFLTMTIFIGKIEGYTQEAALEFYKQHAGEDCYIRTLGFKSYAHLFYGKTLPQENPLYYDNDWLLTGKIDKPAYFVYKVIKKDEISRYNLGLTLLYEKNGFIFAARYPEKQNTGL